MKEPYIRELRMGVGVMTDEKIIELYFVRNEVAIEETDRKYGAYCFQISNNILNCREDSEECVNDTWLKTWDSIPPTRPQCFRLFLARIVRNLSFNKYKAKYTDKRGNGEIALILDELEECIAGKNDVEDFCMTKELQNTLDMFVCSLPERECNVFVRRYFYSDSIRDISIRYELSENNVRVMLNRTRNKLKVRLEKEGYFV